MKPWAWLGIILALIGAGFGLHRYQISLINQGRDLERVELAKQAMKLADRMADASRELKEKADAAAEEARVQRDRNRTAAAAARSELDGLRGDLERARADGAGSSCPAETQRANTAGDLLLACAAEYQEVARAADAHVADLVEHRSSWPEFDEFKRKVREFSDAATR